MALLMITASEAQKAPASGELALEKAIALYRADDYNQARTQLETLVKTEPTNATVCYYLGLSIHRAGGKDYLVQASAWLDKAVALDPKNQPYLVDAGGDYLRASRSPEIHQYGQTRSRHDDPGDENGPQ
jgi:Flp pilus assembly protein TadD